MNYIFEKGSQTNEQLMRKLVDFFIQNSNKKIRVTDQDDYEHEPLRWINNTSNPMNPKVGCTITDIYDHNDCSKILNTVMQLYLGKHLPLGDRDAICISSGSTVEFNKKGFVIIGKKDGDTALRTLTVKILGFENVSFE